MRCKIIKENKKRKADKEIEIDEAGYAELEEKISTLALSIVTSFVEGNILTILNEQMNNMFHFYIDTIFS